MKKGHARAGLLLVAIIWALGYIATLDTLNYMNITQMQVFRFAISVIFLLIIFHKRFKHVPKRAIFFGITLGIIFFISVTIHSAALEYTTISKNAFIVILNIVFVPIIMKFVFKTKIENYYIYGVMTILIGFTFLIFNLDIFNLGYSFNNLASQMNINFGDFLTFISSFTFSFHIVLISYFVTKEDPIHLVVIQLAVAGILSYLYSIVNQDAVFTIPIETIIGALPAIIFLGICGALGFAGQLVFQKHLPASNVAVIISTESLFATIFSVVLGLESFSSGLFIGAILITIGIIWTETGFKFNNKN